jgi:hypothetical protein
VVVATASAAQSSVLTYSSAFDSSSEGWAAVDEPGGSIGTLTWQSAGGNPGGYITAQFSSGNGLLESSPATTGSTWPGGNAVDDYGGTLGADVRVNLASPSSTQVLVGFYSSNSNAQPCAAGTPGASWTTDSATLDAKHFNNDCGYPYLLNAAKVNAALAGFKGIFLYAGNVGGVSETLDVDNAELTGPLAGGSHPVGTIATAFGTFAYKRGKFHGTLYAGYDFSCVEGKQVTIFRKATKPVKIGTTTTSASTTYGSTPFTLTPKKILKGSYYASVTKQKSSLDGNTCAAAQSSKATIR